VTTSSATAAANFVLLSGANTFTGGVTLQSGPLRVGNNSALGTGTLTILGGTLASSSSVARSLTNPVVVAGNFILGQASTVTGPITLSGPMTLGAATRMITVSNTGPNVISGAISGGASLTKAGPGALTLSGANTYTGPTVVSNTGTLLVNGSLKSSSLTVRTGAAFGGNGSVAGAVLVSSGGKLAPGNNGLGTLTISNTLTLSAGSVCVMELNRTTGAYDAIRGLSVVNYGGTLIVTNLGGSFQGGEAYPLFPPAAYTGKFAETNLPPLSGGLRWIWNPDTGVLSVGHPIAATPTNIVFNISGNSVSLAWPESHLGWLVQSNAVDVAEAAGWGDIAGSQFLTNLNITINPTTTNVFFRLRRP
jgi:autotransporter-associated beta strand protein